MCDQWPNIISKNISSPSKSHTTTNFHKEIIQKMYPYYLQPPDPCYQFFPFSIIDTKHNKNTPLLLSATPPHLHKFVIPLNNTNIHDGSKNKFRIHMIYFYLWGLFNNTQKPLFCINNRVRVLKVNGLRTHHFLIW